MMTQQRCAKGASTSFSLSNDVSFQSAVQSGSPGSLPSVSWSIVTGPQGPSGEKWLK